MNTGPFFSAHTELTASRLWGDIWWIWQKVYWIRSVDCTFNLNKAVVGLEFQISWVRECIHNNTYKHSMSNICIYRYICLCVCVCKWVLLVKTNCITNCFWIMFGPMRVFLCPYHTFIHSLHQKALSECFTRMKHFFDCLLCWPGNTHTSTWVYSVASGSDSSASIIPLALHTSLISWHAFCSPIKSCAACLF